MELTMTNNFGFCDLNEQEMMAVDDGWNVKQWLGGCGMVIGGTVLMVGGVMTGQGTTAAIGSVAYVNGISQIYHSF